MDVREKLVELLDDCQAKGFWLYGKDCKTGEVGGHEMSAEDIASYLIENCVTVQEWISVEDRLPEQGQEVIVYSGGVLKPTVFAYQFWNKNYDSWARVTHWQPMPQPPKGE